MTIHGLNPYALHLRLLSSDSVLYGAERILGPISDGIRRAGEDADRAWRPGDDDFADAVVDDACNVIEALLGALFVVCQAYVNTTAARVRSLHTFCKKRGVPLGSLSPKRAVLVATHGAQVAASGLTLVQGIDTAADYFKHGGEWPAGWSLTDEDTKEMKKRGKGWEPPWYGTARRARALGLTPGSTGNLRTAAETLANPEYRDVLSFLRHVKSWLSALDAAYRSHLSQEGVLK